MKHLSILLGILVTAAPVVADTPATNAPPTAPAPAPASVAAPAPPPAPPQSSGPKLNDYMGELKDTLKLTDSEKKSIETYYLADGVLLNNILNNDSLSPIQKAQEVSDLRDARNTKIEALLHDIDRQKAFLPVEAKYRVAMTELAADGGLIPAPAVK